jgi:hypothetical protein
MKQFVLASALAVATVFSAALPSEAASVTITTDNGGRHYYRHADRPYYRHHMLPRRVAHDCFTKRERIHRHGHTIVKETRVCR